MRRTPEARWLTLSAGTFTWRDLEQRVNDYGVWFEMKGVREGDTVLIILKESLDLFASFIGAMIHGAMPAYYAYPSPKQPVDAFLASLDHLMAYNAVTEVVCFSEVAEVIDMNAVAPSRRLSVTRQHEVPVTKRDWLSEERTPRGEAFLQFSSGTTGAKKGVRITSAALFNQVDGYAPIVKLDEGSTVASWLPHYHDMGLIACMLMPLLKGASIVMLSPFEWVKNPGSLLKAITEHRATHTWLPNFALAHLTRSIREEDLAQYDLSSLKQLISCSEPVLHNTVRAFVEKFSRCGVDDRQLYNCYAMAENTFAISSTRGGGIRPLEVDPAILQREGRIIEMRSGRPIMSAGRPLDNVSVSIRGSQGESMPEDEVGEIVISSNCMLTGYHNNAEATERAFVNDWFRTGDRGFIHAGELYVTGRDKDVIIVGGENIFPEDVENVLNETPGLIPGRNVVFGVTDDVRGTETVVALAETDGTSAPDPTDIRTRIQSALNVSLGDLVFLPHMSLRKGTAGKISRFVNKQRYLDGQWHQNRGVDPPLRLSVRNVVLDLVPETSRPTIQELTPLMASGLIDSFGFADLIHRLEQTYQVPIPERLWSVDNFESIARIEALLEQLRAHGPDGIMVACGDSSAQRDASLRRLTSALAMTPERGALIERLINASPSLGGWWYRTLFRFAGIQLGDRVRFGGRVRVKLRGSPGNIRIGNGVMLDDGVDLRIRENGRIRLEDGVQLDQRVRLVVARDGIVAVGLGSSIGVGTVINSGGMTTIGVGCLIAGSVHINSSTHGSARAAYIKEQPYSHGTVEIGDDVWVGAGASILPNSKIGTGAIVSSNSLVRGEIPPFVICAGVPARIIQHR